METDGIAAAETTRHCRFLVGVFASRGRHPSAEAASGCGTIARLSVGRTARRLNIVFDEKAGRDKRIDGRHDGIIGEIIAVISASLVPPAVPAGYDIRRPGWCLAARMASMRIASITRLAFAERTGGSSPTPFSSLTSQRHCRQSERSRLGFFSRSEFFCVGRFGQTCRHRGGWSLCGSAGTRPGAAFGEARLEIFNLASDVGT